LIAAVLGIFLQVHVAKVGDIVLVVIILRGGLYRFETISRDVAVYVWVLRGAPIPPIRLFRNESDIMIRVSDGPFIILRSR
jgi:hypothetical protein